ncbi:eosinophil peroxidase-like [Neosynchiropus ocellatus]
MSWCVSWFAAAVTLLCLQTQLTSVSGLSQDEIENFVLLAKASVDSAYKYSRAVSLNRVRRNEARPSDLLRLIRQPSGLTRSAVRAADYMDHTFRLIKRSLSRHKRSLNATDGLSEETLKTVAELTGCSARHRVPVCETTSNVNTFRTASSVCNNRKNTRWGATNIPLTRWLPAEYQDNISEPKGWDSKLKINGHLLPLVREVSNRILRTTTCDIKSDPLYTDMLTMYGQWIDHDLSFTPMSAVIRSFNEGMDCDKSCDRSEPCFPIEIPKLDPRFGRNSDQCIPFFRSAAACGTGTTGYFFGKGVVRQQMNGITSYIDVDQVYGSDNKRATALRNLTSDEGLLRVNTKYKDGDRDLLPFTSTGANMCATRARITGINDIEEIPCFFAGDKRANENIGLTSVHALMMREHNRLARALREMNGHWSGERIYQETRKIMGAYFQVITYRDYLPHIVGKEVMAEKLPNYPGYDESVDASISNVFATAAFRFGHVAIQPFLFRLNEKYQDHPTYPSPMLHKALFTPWRIPFEGGLDPILRGLLGGQAKLNAPDSMMPDALRDRMFEFSTNLALDLASLNLQRGRDHGLPGYNKWRKHCGLSELTNVTELIEVMEHSDLAHHLMGLYGTIDNIDVWLGGIAEPFVKGGRVGPLFACLIASQFQKIRQGDRFWWEKEGVFTAAQRNSLKGTSFSRFICDNTGIDEVPKDPFLYHPRGDGYTKCEDIPAFDLSPWKDEGRFSDIKQQ